MIDSSASNFSKLVQLRKEGNIPFFIMACLDHAIEKGGKLKEFLQFSKVFPVVNTPETEDLFQTIMEMLVFSIFPSDRNSPVPNTAEELFRLAEIFDRPLTEEEKNNPASVYVNEIRDSLLLIGSIVQNCFKSVKENDGFVFGLVSLDAEGLAKLSGLSDVWTAIGDTMNVILTSIEEKNNPQSTAGNSEFQVRYQ